MPRQPQPAPIDGALVINKPKGKTSHDVVDAVRHLAGFRQIGHLGTLDPLATGVLVLLLGRATRLVRFYAGRRKRYEAGFRFGFATDTYDSDGEARGPATGARCRNRRKVCCGVHWTVRTDAAVVFREESERAPRVRAGAEKRGR